MKKDLKGTKKKKSYLVTVPEVWYVPYIVEAESRAHAEEVAYSAGCALPDTGFIERRPEEAKTAGEQIPSGNRAWSVEEIR